MLFVCAATWSGYGRLPWSGIARPFGCVAAIPRVARPIATPRDPFALCVLARAQGWDDNPQFLDWAHFPEARARGRKAREMLRMR